MLDVDALFLSTLSLRRATHGHCAFGHAVDISIHALLAESDAWTASSGDYITEISIHALLAESDGQLGGQRQPPAISIHALLAESDAGSTDSTPHLTLISIHALLAESDRRADAF